MLHICKPLLYKGKVIVVDSGFVLQIELLHLRRRECRAALSSRSAVTGRKIPGDLINRYFLDKEVGDVYMLEADI